MDTRFLTQKSAFIKSPADNKGKHNILLLESGNKVAQVLSKVSLLDSAKEVIVYISHWHPDHFYDAEKVAKLCKHRGIPISFIDYPKEFHTNHYYKLKDLGISRPNMIKRDEAENLMHMQSINFEKLRHTCDTNTVALVMEEKSSHKRRFTKFVPDTNDILKCYSLFKDNIDNLERLFFDVTNKDQLISSHLSYETVEKFNIPKDTRKRFVAFHYPKKRCDSLKKKINELGYGTHDSYLYENLRQNSLSQKNTLHSQHNHA